MSHDGGRSCGCVAEHRPAALELNRHHVWPLYLGGPDVPTNIVWLCPTTHVNVHELMRHLLTAGPLTYAEAQAASDRPVSRYAFRLALSGYLSWRSTHAAATPAPITGE